MSLKPDYISPDGSVQLYCADCLEVLPTLEAGGVDAVVTDSPYSSGGQFRSDRAASTSVKYNGFSHSPDETREPEAEYPEFTGDNKDQRAFLHWSCLWMDQAREASVSGAPLMTFTDWRQLPITTDAIQGGGWIWRGVVVWDKGVGRPMKGRFRNHVEYVCWGSNGPMGEPPEVYPSSVMRFTPPTSATRVHRTEKPVELIEALLPITAAYGTILDPFMGSGTTGVACIKTGRNFIGIEKEPKYFDIARKRIEQAFADQALFREAVAV